MSATAAMHAGISNLSLELLAEAVPLLPFPSQGLLVEEVGMSGHILVCGACTPPAALLSLLAPLRSQALPSCIPVVILDQHLPEGPAWDDIARWVRLA